MTNQTPDQTPDHNLPQPFAPQPQPPYYPQSPPYAGQPYPQSYYPQPAPVVPTSGNATASLVFGVIGMLGGFLICGIPCLLAVLFGHLALRETKTGQRGGHDAPLPPHGPRRAPGALPASPGRRRGTGATTGTGPVVGVSEWEDRRYYEEC